MEHRYMWHMWGTKLQETHLNGTQIGQPHLGDKNLLVLPILLVRRNALSFKTSVNICQITYRKTFIFLPQQDLKCPPPLPMPPHVLMDFVVFPPGHDRSVTDF